MKKIQFYVFRHGETDWNVERRFQGHTDIPLNTNGRLQAHSLAARLKAANLDVIISSDLIRATKTAEIVANSLNIEVAISSLLREARLGDPEGRLRNEIIIEYGAEKWARWNSVKEEDLDFGYPNGETKMAQLERVRNFLEKFSAENPHYKRIGVSTHGGCLRRLAHSCKNSPTEPIPLPNCAVYELAFFPSTQEWDFVGAIKLSNTHD